MLDNVEDSVDVTKSLNSMHTELKFQPILYGYYSDIGTYKTNNIQGVEKKIIC